MTKIGLGFAIGITVLVGVALNKTDGENKKDEFCVLCFYFRTFLVLCFGQIHQKTYI